MEKIENTHFDDEIDLFDLWITLVSEWKAIMLSLAVILAVALGYVLAAKPVYESQAVLIKPYESQLADLKLLPSVAVTPDRLYNEFRNQLTGSAVIEAVLQHPQYKQAIIQSYGFTDTTKQTQQISAFLQKKLNISLPSNKTHNELQSRFDESIIKFDFIDAKLAALILKFLVTKANTLAVDNLMADWKGSLSKQLQAEKQKYTLIDENIQAELDNQISRLENEKKLKVSRLLLKINSLLSGAKLSKENRIKQLKEDYKIAKKLNIKEPIEPGKYAILAGKNVAIPSIDLTTDSGLRGYWLGTKIISEEMDKLTQRKDLSAFIPNIVALKQELIEVEKDPELKLLKERTDNLPYSKKLRDSLANQRSLSQQLTNLGTVKFQTYSYKQWPTEPLKPIKPKSMLILAVASVMGLFLGIFIALMRGAYKKRQSGQGCSGA